MTNEEIKIYMQFLFEGYKFQKRKGELYTTVDIVPRKIINYYYKYIDNPQFDKIFTTFRKKYIQNENKVEQVHSQQEREGMGIVYDYIQNGVKPNDLNIYIILKIHQLLYSKMPYPEFGGSFRTEQVYLPYANIEISNFDEIPANIAKLYGEANKLIKKGLELSKTNNKQDDILKYIDDCIELNCKLIKIHPFRDGNGRTIRSFTNLLFKLANIPPVFIKESEQQEYRQAMNNAIAFGKNDYSSIKTFYHYKICESIIELDTSINELDPTLEDKPKVLIKK